MNREKGFALLDVIAGMMILAIGITCLADLTASARQALAASRWRGQALNSAQTELEQIKTMGVEKALNSGKVVPDETVETVEPNGIKLQVYSQWVGESADLLGVKVTSVWFSGQRKGTVVLDTLISRR